MFLELLEIGTNETHNAVGARAGGQSSLGKTVVNYCDLIGEHFLLAPIACCLVVFAIRIA